MRPYPRFAKYTACARCRIRLFGPSFHAARSVSHSASLKGSIRFIAANPLLSIQRKYYLISFDELLIRIIPIGHFNFPTKKDH